jgi:type IV pilus assembly protein PilC
MAANKQLTAAELSLFFGNLELVYHSGLPLQEGFSILSANARGSEQKSRMDRLNKAAGKGEQLSKTLESLGVLPSYAVSLIRIGEQTGRMEESCRSLARYYQRRDELNRNVRSSLVYPVSMMVMVLLVVVLLLTQAMPVFEQVFAQLGFTMTGVSRALLDIGNLLSRYTLVIAIAIVAIIAAVLVLRLTPPGRRFFTWLYQNNPVTANLSLHISTQRFALALSTLLEAGLTVDEALPLAASTVDDRRAAGRVAKMRECMKKGDSFPDAVQNSGLFPPATMSLLAVSFKTGTDAEALAQIGDQIAINTEDRMETVIAAIEPTLVGIMCLLVGVILLSVMLPLLGILGSV